jgi:tetratricopeptide (TPR) repeat protein
LDPFAWLLLLQLAVASADEAVADRLNRARERAAVFESARAAAAYEDVLALDPANADALIGACRAYNDLGREATGDQAVAHLETALRHARRLQQQFPDRPEGHFWVAATSGNLTVHRPAGEKVRLSREVEKNARQAIAVDPCFAPAWAALGIYDREVAALPWFVRAMAGGFMGGLPGGSLEESARKLEKAAALDPASVYDHYELGLTYEKMKRTEDAVEQFRLAVVLSATEAQEPAAQADARERLFRLSAPPRQKH